MADMTLLCPTPLQYQQIVMAHGGGGRLMQQLLSRHIQPIFANPILAQQSDSAILPLQDGKLAFTTDSYVIHPLFFPDGDIGKLAVCGTLNDLATSGANPLYLSCALIIEEGLAIDDLERILQSMQKAAEAAGVSFVTGDTKVVDRGKGDGLYINTTGIGVIQHDLTIAPHAIRLGDAILVSGDLGRHGMAVLLEREGLEFQHPISSDCADLSGVVAELLAAGLDIHCLRDATRGGLASILLELASTTRQHFEIVETTLPVSLSVRSACELLGFDPLYVANEGCMALFLPETQVDAALKILRHHPHGQHATCIGTVLAAHDDGQVTLRTALGISRVLALLSGEQLPRIC